MTTPDLTPTPTLPADTTTPAAYDELVRYIAAEASHAPPQFAPAWADYLLAGYRMTPRATPPVDTRQQAAEAFIEYADSLREAADREYLVGPEERRASQEEFDNLAGSLRAVLASSSPALPEPPAPTHGKVWTEWRLGMGTVAVDPKSRVLSVAVSVLNHTPAEARLLASTLLAAADVAEEQQP